MKHDRHRFQRSIMVLKNGLKILLNNRSHNHKLLKILCLSRCHESGFSTCLQKFNFNTLNDTEQIFDDSSGTQNETILYNAAEREKTQNIG